MKIILIFFFGGMFFGSIEQVTATSQPLSERSMFEKTVREILILGKRIETYDKEEQQRAFQQKREILSKNILTVLANVDTRIYRKPTFDATKKYNLYLQKYKLSCEIAALSMILEAITHKVYSEDFIIRGIPIFPQALSRDRIWGDPEREFVGSYTGSQRKHTGYGIYEFPLQRYLRYEGISSRVSNRFDGRKLSPRNRLTEALDTLSSSGHVLLWGDWCTSPQSEDGLVESVDSYITKKLSISSKNTCDRDADERFFSWKTREGKTIRGLSGEHAFLLLGYIGTRENPTHIIVWDTDTGRHIYPYHEWMRKWALMDYRSLIIGGK